MNHLTFQWIQLILLWRTFLQPIPVSLITGFLGSGKTKLLSKLLKQQNKIKIALIINEFGEIGLDHHLVERGSEEIMLLRSGCLCCTVRTDLSKTLNDLFAKLSSEELPAFDRVVIETTGLADPAPIIHTLMDDGLIAPHFELDSVVTTVDACHGHDTLNRQFESVKQVAMADRLVVIKTDLVNDQRLRQLQGRLRQLNPAAPILHSTQGDVNPADLFDAGFYNVATKSLDVQVWLKEEAYRDTSQHGLHHDDGYSQLKIHDEAHAHGHAHHHDVNRHDDRIRAFCFTYEKPLPPKTVDLWLQQLMDLRGPDFLRIKGIVNLMGSKKPVVIHGVQALFHAPVVLDKWPSEDKRTRIVFITRYIGWTQVAAVMQTIHGAVGGNTNPYLN
jgi:G3E family GTPase